MEYKEYKPAGQKNIKKIILIAAASLVAVGVIGFGTVALLKQFKAPTLSGNSQTQGDNPTPTTPTVATPEEALATADKAASAAAEKASAGNQEAALTDYKTAFENYKIAENADRAAEMEFSIKAIELALNQPQNPGKPTGTKASAKE